MLLVAGDLFSELARPDGLRETIRHWQDVFAEFLAAGGTILTLTGNHDNENFCQTLLHAMTLAAPTVGKPGECVPPGRRERLRHVVVRAELETDDPVGLLAPRGQEDDREVGARPDPAAELEPVDAR